MTLRYYSNAPETTLTLGVTSAATAITVASTSGLPVSYPFILIVDRGTSSEEVVLCTNAAGTTLTVQRGYDSTAAFAHNAGATVAHGISAIDPREANAHVNATSGVHGVAGALVGTNDAQALTNKTLGTTNTINGFTASRFMEADGTGKLVSGSKAIPTGAVVGTTDTQTLSGKGIDLGTNTVTGTKAQFNTACTDADFATLAGAETLTSKTLTDPTITFGGQSLSGVWTTYTPTWTCATTNPTLGNGTLSGAYLQVGKTTYFRIILTIGSTTNCGAGRFRFTLPTTPAGAPDRNPPFLGEVYDLSANNPYPFMAVWQSAITTMDCNAWGATAGGPIAGITATSPFTWATGDILTISGVYTSA